MDENIERVTTGVEGLDDMLNGGIPKGHVFTVMGSFGTGKTTFALQFLWEGLKRGEKCIFISLEEDKDAISITAKSYGWDIAKYIESEQIVVEKLSPADAHTTINRLKSDLPGFIKSFDADRIAIDSVSLLNMLSDEPKEKREHLFGLCKMVKDTGATALLTAEVKDDNPRSSRDGLVEYTTDGVILLKYEMVKASEVKLTIQVVKMRRIKHTRHPKPYEITDDGIEVLLEGAVF